MAAGSIPSDAERTRAFLALHSRHARWIYGYLLSLARNQADAEDLFSETTTTLWEKFDQFDPATEFRAWACRVAQFKYLEWQKKLRRVPTPVDAAFLEAVTEAHVASATTLDAAARLEECVAQLTEADRAVLKRRYEPGATVKSVAQVLGRSVHQVYRRLNRIHDMLLECIRRKESEAKEG
ncbi:MAG: sigma-70 family RNA polymerase sigma factor [Planctomycetes bacterium]|nr:sigma-70 family RNA polymerase sigma factor [Planctomycetota bacterium]